MFTPQRNKRSGLWFSAAGDHDNGSILGKSKGKGVEGDEGPLVSPPQALLGDKGSDSVVHRGEVDDWRSFKEAGLLDQSVLQRRDRGALIQRISDIEKELHEYQYNMGLLLIEKKDWFSKYEEMREGRAEAEVMLKREQTAHLISVSDLQKREENMKKALGVEKQCVADLEKALREMRAEIAEVKFTSEKKLADANSLEATIEAKHLEVEGKLHSADAKLAEASRKSSEINRKMEDLEARERKLQRDFLSLNNERKAHEKDLSEQRQHLQNWEKKLQEGQKRLVDGQRFLNEREERANESESILKKKEEEIEEARRAIEDKYNSLKDKDDDVNTRLGSLTIKEEEIESKKQNLVKKEKDLLAMEEKLNAREKVELQKLLDDHNAILDAKKHDFELEIDQKRKSFTEELNTKLETVEKEKTGVLLKEKEVVKREQTLENKMEKLKIKEKDLDTKSKALKKWEECIKDDERKLQAEKQQLGHDTQELVVSKSVLESLKSAIESEKLQISSEKESLKVTQDEREHLLLLQSKLKQEIEEYQTLKESFLRESETLRQERVKFEKEWEALDEKRVAFEAEVQRINDERSNFEKWRHNEEERLSKEVYQARVDVNRELENLQLKREAFESTMEFERSEAREMLKRERADIAREHELRRHELEMDMQKKREEMEKKMQERESDFDRRESELSHIKTSSSLNESSVRKMKMEQDRLAREKEQLSILRTKLEADRVEIHQDIDTAGVLSKNLKGQREEFIKERAHLLALANECKTCKNCGVTIHEFELLGFKSTRENELVENTVLPSLSDGRFADMASPLSPGSGGARVSWLQKCSNLFKPSPNKKAVNSAEGPPLDMLDSIAETSDIASLKSSGIKDSEEQKILAVEGGRRTRSDNNSGGRAAEQILPSVSEQNEMEVSSPPPEIDPQPSKQRRQQPGRKVGRPKTIRRTKSVAAVVEDAKAFLGEASGLEKNGHLKPHHEESLGESGRSSQVAARGGQKRRLPNTDEDAEDSEVRSESVSQGGRRKRRQTSVPAVQPPAEKRYNLRRSKRASTAATAQGTADQTKVIKEVSLQEPLESEEVKDADNGEGTSQHGHSAAPSVRLGGEIKETTDIMEETIAGNLLGIQDISSQKLARFEAKRTTRVELSRDIRSAEDIDEVDGSEAALEETGTPSDSEDSDDDEDSEKGNASIGKKLWTFFTT